MPRDSQATFSASVRLSLRKKYQDRCVASETVNNVVKIINELKQKGELTCY
jgi:hypothetical protein